MVDAMHQLESTRLRHRRHDAVAVGQAPPRSRSRRCSRTRAEPADASDPTPDGFPKAGDNFVDQPRRQGLGRPDFSQFGRRPGAAVPRRGRRPAQTIKVKWALPGGMIYDSREPALPRPARQLLPAAAALRRAVLRSSDIVATARSAGTSIRELDDRPRGRPHCARRDRADGRERQHARADRAARGPRHRGRRSSTRCPTPPTLVARHADAPPCVLLDLRELGRRRCRGRAPRDRGDPRGDRRDPARACRSWSPARPTPR